MTYCHTNVMSINCIYVVHWPIRVILLFNKIITMFTQAATGFLAVLFFLQLQLLPFSGAVIPVTDDPAEAWDLAEEAYIFFAPVISNWHFLFLTTTPSPSAVFDTFQHGDSFRPPNENVVYSIGWMDLRQEPRVVTMSPVQGGYYSVQIVDGYTHNIGTVSERTFPMTAQSGKFIVAGPGQCIPQARSKQFLIRQATKWVWLY